MAYGRVDGFQGAPRVLVKYVAARCQAELAGGSIQPPRTENAFQFVNLLADVRGCNQDGGPPPCCRFPPPS